MKDMGEIDLYHTTKKRKSANIVKKLRMCFFNRFLLCKTDIISLRCHGRKQIRYNNMLLRQLKRVSPENHYKFVVYGWGSYNMSIQFNDRVNKQTVFEHALLWKQLICDGMPGASFTPPFYENTITYPCFIAMLDYRISVGWRGPMSVITNWGDYFIISYWWWRYSNKIRLFKTRFNLWQQFIRSSHHLISRQHCMGMLYYYQNHNVC